MVSFRLTEEGGDCGFNLFLFLTQKKESRKTDSGSYISNDLITLANKEVMPKLMMLANKKANIGAKFITSRTNANKTVIRLKLAIRAKKTNSFSFALWPLNS